MAGLTFIECAEMLGGSGVGRTSLYAVCGLLSWSDPGERCSSSPFGEALVVRFAF